MFTVRLCTVELVNTFKWIIIIIIIITDPLRTTLGNCDLQSYRLTEKVLKLMSDDDPFTPERRVLDCALGSLIKQIIVFNHW